MWIKVILAILMNSRVIYDFTKLIVDKLDGSDDRAKLKAEILAEMKKCAEKGECKLEE